MIGSNSENNINSALTSKNSAVFAKRNVIIASNAVYNYISMTENPAFMKDIL